MTTLDFTPVDLDLVLYEGDGDAAVLDFVDIDSGDPIDISAYTWVATWRAKRGADDPIDIPIDDSAASSGTLVVQSSADVSRSIAAVRRVGGVWDLQGTIPGSDPQTPLGGKVVVTQDVSE